MVPRRSQSAPRRFLKKTEMVQSRLPTNFNSDRPQALKFDAPETPDFLLPTKTGFRPTESPFQQVGRSLQWVGPINPRRDRCETRVLNSMQRSISERNDSNSRIELDFSLGRGYAVALGFVRCY